jgi:hypothetical protein
MPIATDGIDTNGTESFLKTLLPPEDAAQPSEEEKGSTTPEHTEAETPETEEDAEAPSSETEGEPEKPSKRYVDDDEVYVKVKVGEDEYEVPVKDLKRLHGQEASLTRKSQQVAEQTKAIENQRTAYAHKLDTMVNKATEKANQYRQVNFHALAKDPNVSAEMLGALEQEARRAFEEEAFLKGEVNQFVQSVNQERQNRLVNTARESLKQINDPDNAHHIPNFNQKLHDEMMQFAVDNGIPREMAINTVDAPTLKLLHMAMSYMKGQSKVATKVVNKSPKKIMKTSTVPQPRTPIKKNRDEANKRLKEHGSLDNAANAFMAGWATED